MKARLLSLAILSLVLVGLTDVACAQRAASPRGEAATQIGSDGPWLVVDYGRPILRGRTNIFGSGADYGQGILAGAPVWRAGANVSTTLTTETDLMFGNNHLPAGTYTLFVEHGAGGSWTLIVSNHVAKPQYQGDEPGIWGAYGYTPDKDVFRVPMQVQPLDGISVDEFTISFMNMTSSSGMLAMIWEDTMATVPFMVH